MSSAGPLAGLKVVELGQLIAGPFAAKTLADFGALRWHPGSAVAVVIAAENYPGRPRLGDAITGAGADGVLHAGTARRDDGAIVSAGGRVLAVVGTGADLAAARTDDTPGSNAHTNPSPIVFHCSGAQGSALLAPLAALGWRVASAHCILSFASVPGAIQQFPGTPCALEGDAQACDVLRPVFAAIGARCFGVASRDKLLYHAAAVFATNFLPVLQATAEELWQSTGMPAELIPALRASLLHNAVANITAQGPQAALTGPAARGDKAAIARQGAAVTAWDAPTGAAYEALSTLALRLAGHGAN